MNPALRKAFGVCVTLVLVMVAGVAAYWMWHHYEVEPWTRDGKVRADVVRVAADVSGLVTEVLVHDNQVVVKGQPLFVVDAPRYRLAVAQAEAAIASARTGLAQAQREMKRDSALGDLVAGEQREQSRARVDSAMAALEQARAAADVARLNLRRTTVIASVNGTVTNLQLRPGDYMQAGSQAMALIDADSFHVDGYFEETKLPRIHIGDTVKVKLMGEDQLIDGRVESIAAGIDDRDRSSASNLLPSVNPTFNWVRLAQRVPVRVKLLHVPKDIRLIAGRTATVTVVEREAAAGKANDKLAGAAR